MIINELLAVTTRIEKGRRPPGLLSAECNCSFFHKYALPCKHIFHEHVYGTTKLLTSRTWRNFQIVFEESGFEVYERREVVEVDELEEIKEQGEAESRRLAVNEFMERVRDRYWDFENRGVDEETNVFIKKLESALSYVL